MIEDAAITALALACAAAGYFFGSMKPRVGAATISAAPIVLEVSAKPLVLDVTAPPVTLTAAPIEATIPVSFAVTAPESILLRIDHDPVQLKVAPPEPVKLDVTPPPTIMLSARSQNGPAPTVAEDTCNPAIGYHATPHKGGGCVLG